MKPDFSGEWVLDRQASTLSSHAAAFQSGGLTIDHRDPVFNFKIRMVADGAPVEHAGDGLIADAAGDDLISLYWDGDAIVMTNRAEGPEPAWAMSFRYELLDEGRRLRWVERIRGAGRDQDNVWVFDRG